MERQYVAIDLHLNRSVIVTENEAGEKVGVTRIENDPLALADALRDAGEAPEVAIEATWYWAVDVLGELGADVHLVNPSGLNWEDRRVKNDYRDCCELLDRMRLGKLPEAWIAPHAVRELRELVRYRARLVMLRTGLKAQLKAVLAKHGLRLRSRTCGVSAAHCGWTSWICPGPTRPAWRRMSRLLWKFGGGHRVDQAAA